MARHGIGDDALVAIIVGSILGAIMLGLVILVAILSLKRRKVRLPSSRREGGSTPTSIEVERWKLKHSGLNGSSTSTQQLSDEHKSSTSLPATNKRATTGMQEVNQKPLLPTLPLLKRVSLSDLADLPSEGVPRGASYFNYASDSWERLPNHRSEVGDAALHGSSSDLSRGSNGNGAVSAPRAPPPVHYPRNSDRPPREVVEMPTEISPKRNRASAERKPERPAVSFEIPPPRVFNSSNKSSFEGRRSQEGSGVVSPLSPDLVELPSPPFDLNSHAIYSSSTESITLKPNVSSNASDHVPTARPPVVRQQDQAGRHHQPLRIQRDDSFKIEFPKETTQSGYRAYQPGVSSEPYGPSRTESTTPTTHQQRHISAPPKITEQTSPRSSLQYPLAFYDGVGFVTSGRADRKSTESGYALSRAEDGDIPMVWRRSPEHSRRASTDVKRDRNSAKDEKKLRPGLGPFHSSSTSGRSSASSETLREETSPIKELPKSAMTYTVSAEGGFKKPNVKRVSLNDLIEDERRKEERRKRRQVSYHGGALTYGDSNVGQAF